MLKNMVGLFLWIWFLAILKASNGAEILIMPSSLNPVHRFTMRHLAEELIKRQHTVTWFEYGLKKPDIELPTGVNEIYVEVDTPNQSIKDLYLHRNHSSVTTRLWEEKFWNSAEQTSGWLASIELCDRLLQNAKTKTIFHQLVTKEFGAVVVDDLYNPPPSYIPVAGTGLTDELNAFQRGYNMAAYLRQLYYHQHIVLRRIDALITDLDKFVSAANDNQGFIVIAAGFTVQWQHAPNDVVNNLLEAIRQKSDIQFVWQYNGPDLDNPPKNLYLSKWLPQQDLLGHSKCRAFISHGGLNSVIESTWHGVPVIGWPLTSSGYDNLLRVTARQSGLMLDKKHLSTLEWDMVVDVPYTELNHSAFWVEFIVRHQEVPHARSGADELNILQYFLVDIIAFVLGLTALALVITITLLKLIVRSIIFLIKLPFRGTKTVEKSGNEKRQKSTTLASANKEFLKSPSTKLTHKDSIALVKKKN